MKPPYGIRKVAESPYCEVRDSIIHGRGLFATCDIAKETQVIEYAGEIVDKDESNRRGLEQEEMAEKTGEGAVYIFELNEMHDIDGNFDWNPARLANHSCDPNCEAENVDDHIWIVAIKDIQKGEEITFDYGYDISHYERHPCRCGSANCVGYIVHRDQRRELKKLLKKKGKAGKVKKTSTKKKKSTGKKKSSSKKS
jgi:hypothetical protein